MQPTQSNVTELDPSLCPPSADSSRASDCTLDRLTVALAEHLSAEGRARASKSGGAEVAALLRAYAEHEESWRRYTTFRDDTYSRNLIWRSADFELLLLCWNSDQVSPIHDHAGQHCWMAVLDGNLEEVHFRARAAGEPCDAPLSEGRVKRFETGGVAYIHDDIALHLIRPADGQPAVSLHLYSSPIDSCRTFCGETGTPAEATMRYHTVRGTACETVDAAKIRSAWERKNS